MRIDESLKAVGAYIENTVHHAWDSVKSAFTELKEAFAKAFHSPANLADKSVTVQTPQDKKEESTGTEKKFLLSEAKFVESVKAEPVDKNSITSLVKEVRENLEKEIEKLRNEIMKMDISSSNDISKKNKKLTEAKLMHQKLTNISSQLKNANTDGDLQEVVKELQKMNILPGGNLEKT